MPLRDFFIDFLAGSNLKIIQKIQIRILLINIIPRPSSSPSKYLSMKNLVSLKFNCIFKTDKNIPDWDKIQLKEDRYMQEHYHWAKVQNLWDHYVKKQKEILSNEEYQLRVSEGYYPEEMPEWWRRRYRQRL